MKIEFSDLSLADLEAIEAWYEERGVPEIGKRFVAEIFQRVQFLIQHPDLGRIVPELAQPLFRELLHPPFRIIYRRDPTIATIVRVWRSERLLKNLT